MQQILHQIREKIVADIEKQLGQELDPRRIDIAMGTCDWAAFELSEGVDYRLLEMRYKTYKEVATRFAGWRTYGLCERCGEEVPVERLKVEPFARYCVPCLTQIEALEAVEKEMGKPSTL